MVVGMELFRDKLKGFEECYTVIGGAACDILMSEADIDFKGYIYIMTNPALPDMVKIGYATDVENRRKQLSTTALPYDYEVYATYETAGNLEDKKLHKLIDNLNPDLRITKNREFFIMSPEDAYELLESITSYKYGEDTF